MNTAHCMSTVISVREGSKRGRIWQKVRSCVEHPHIHQSTVPPCLFPPYQRQAFPTSHQIQTQKSILDIRTGIDTMDGAELDWGKPEPYNHIYGDTSGSIRT